MSKILFSPIDTDELIKKIAEKVTANLKPLVDTTPQPEAKTNPIDDYIPKQEVRGKLASSATLWKWEKAGKLKLYGIGGKRYYKRTDIEKLFVEVKN